MWLPVTTPRGSLRYIKKTILLFVQDGDDYLTVVLLFDGPDGGAETVLESGLKEMGLASGGL